MKLIKKDTVIPTGTRTPVKAESRQSSSISLYPTMKLSLLIAILVCVFQQVGAVPQSQAVRAILGEGANQPFVAKLGIACAIRNRGTLHGVYGVNNIRAQHCTRRVYNDALRAWEALANTDITNGCRYFGCPKDASYFVGKLHFKPFVKYGDITFYKP